MSEHQQQQNAVFYGILLLSLGLSMAILWIGAEIFPPHHQMNLAVFVGRMVLALGLIILGVFILLNKPPLRCPDKTKLALLFASGIICFSVMEAGARIWLVHWATFTQKVYYADYDDVSPFWFRWMGHHYLNHYPTPYYRAKTLYHNSLGYRNNEIVLPKPEGRYRIVTLGGSTTYTIAVEDNAKTYPAQLEQILRHDYGYTQIEVINAGAGAYSSWESLINLQFRVLDLDPDLLIVYHGTNDVHCQLVLPQTYRGDNAGRRKQWGASPKSLWERSVFLRLLLRRNRPYPSLTLENMVNAPTYIGEGSPEFDRLSEEERVAILQQNPPVYFRRNLINMIAIAQAHKIKILFATWTYCPHFNDYNVTAVYQQGYKEINKVIAEVAEDLNTPVFDFNAVMSRDPQYWRDGVHVNEQGALLKARLFAKYLVTSGILEEHQ